MTAPHDSPEEDLERGVGLFGKALGHDQAQALRDHIGSAEFGRKLGLWSAQFAFGTVWGRPGLDPKLRSCAVIGMLIALRQPDELKYHVGIALENGLSEHEIEEVLYQSIPIVGFPAAATAKRAIAAALEEGAGSPR